MLNPIYCPAGSYFCQVLRKLSFYQRLPEGSPHLPSFSIREQAAKQTSVCDYARTCELAPCAGLVGKPVLDEDGVASKRRVDGFG